MSALQIAMQVAAHPTMVKLRTQQEMMRRQMVRDYGDNFMDNSGDMVMGNGRKSPRYEGVHFWTKAQRLAWNNLETRMRNARRTIRNMYV
jgi:hypothetical protein